MAKVKTNNPIKNVLSGIILIIVATILLAYNEQDAVKNIALIKDARSNFIQVNSSPLDSKNESKLIATNGTIDVGGTSIADASFNLDLVDTAAIYRVVEMYQWEEDEESSGDDTTYTYDKKWSTETIDSSDFYEKTGHQNPGKKPYENYNVYNTNSKLGDYNLSETILNQLDTTTLSGLTSYSLNIPSGYEIIGNYITNSKDIDNPEIGDVRISFETIGLIQMSVIGKQSGNDIVQYTISNGKSMLHADNGILDGNALIDQVERVNNIFKWVLRFIGVILSMAAFASLLSPLTFFVSFVPLIGKSIKSFISLIGSMVGLAYSLVIIAIAWLACRPVLGIAMLAVVTGLIVLVVSLVKKSKKQAAAQGVVAGQQPIMQQTVPVQQPNVPVQQQPVMQQQGIEQQVVQQQVVQQPLYESSNFQDNNK